MTTTAKYATLAEDANEMRLLCADILDGLAAAPALFVPVRRTRLTHGAETLRWTAEWSGTTDPADLAAEIYRLTDALEDVRDEVLSIVAAWEHDEGCEPDAKAKACDCGLSQRRTQIRQAASRG